MYGINSQTHCTKHNKHALIIRTRSCVIYTMLSIVVHKLIKTYKYSRGVSSVEMCMSFTKYWQQPVIVWKYRVCIILFLTRSESSWCF